MSEQMDKKHTENFEPPANDNQVEQNPKQKKQSSQNVGENYVRYKKKDLEPEVTEKKEQQKLAIQAELNKQIEDRKKQKMMEKQREREENEKEQQRILKEQAELDAKYKQEASKEGSNGINSKLNKKITNEKNRDIFPGPPQINFEHVVQGHKNVIKQAKEEKKTQPNKPPEKVEIAKKVEQPPEPIKKIEVIIPHREAETNMLETYQREIQVLKNEKLLAKEEALKYKEQLLKERELQCQNMMSMFPQPPKNKVCQQEPLYEESLESSSHRVPTTASNSLGNNNPNTGQEQDFLECSLASNTKLVAVNEVDHSTNDLYKTWKNPIAVQQQLVAKAAALKEQNSKKKSEVAIQTQEEEQKHSQNFQAVEEIQGEKIEESIYFYN